jgi:hypothetical protein
MKMCGKCFDSKPDNKFYATSGNTCKECYKARVRANRNENISHYRAYDRTRYETDPARKELARRTSKSALESGKHTEYTREWRSRNPQKYKAQNAVNNAIARGKLKREPCKICGAKAHAHHEDYSKPLDVIWVCPEHHAEMHKRKKTYDI